MDVFVEVLCAPLRRRTWSHWVFLVLGGAVLSPYAFAAISAGSFLSDADGWTLAIGVLVILGAFAGSVAGTAYLSPVRKIEVVTAKEFLRGPIADHDVPDAVEVTDRLRSAAFTGMHLVGGGVVGVLTLTAIPLALAWLGEPIFGWLEQSYRPGDLPAGVYPVLGAGIIAAYIYLVAGLGFMLATLAPSLLEPVSSERVAELEELADDLAQRNRLARDLHDSVGHALSVVTLQAGAARRMWDKDPAFAYEALGAVEQSARIALADLDHVLGLLREETTEQASATLSQLEQAVRRHRAAGTEIDLRMDGEVSRLPVSLSREAFLIVQEALTNAARHGNGRVNLVIDVAADVIELDIRNAIRVGAPASSRPSGGRGVRGIQERVGALGGVTEIGEVADPEGPQWRVHVRLTMEETQ